MRSIIGPLLLLAALTLGGVEAHAFGALAQSASGSGRGDVESGDRLAAPRLGPNDAAAIVRDRTRGRVLGVRRESLGGRPVYRVKVLTDRGRVKMLRVDANTGSLLD